MKIIIFDFEVFKNNTLFGAKILFDNGNKEFYQTWNLDAIKDFYINNKNCLWVGQNIKRYDNNILNAVINNKNEQEIKKVNDDIIKRDMKKWCNMDLVYYDLLQNHIFALKQMEAYDGKNISESEVDFDIDRPLNDEEKLLTEKYNRDDLNQTEDDFNYLQFEFTQRLDMINEFNLPLKKCLNMTGTQIAETVLHAEKIEGIEDKVKNPVLWPTLKLNNKELIDFYLKRQWTQKKDNTLKLMLCGTEHTIAAGGIHGAKTKFSCKWAYYFDVSGYYNLIMINLDLLPRSIPDEYKKLYEEMYHEQLKLKKTNPRKRGVYKKILLSVFGAMNNEYCKFYDPYNGDLVRLSGQLFLVDLLEKLEGKVEVIQSNTDGIIAYPINNSTDEEVKNILDEWQNRTGFVLKFEKIYDIVQRDVNCYMYKDDKGNIETRGENITHYNQLNTPFNHASYDTKEPLIIGQAIVNYFMNGKTPEETILENKRNLRMFQYICKKSSFDYVEYEIIKNNNEKIITKIQAINRAFATNKFNGMIYKCKFDNNKIKRCKISNLPPSVIIYNDEILSDKAIDELSDNIDYQYYIDRSYEKMATFINL